MESHGHSFSIYDHVTWVEKPHCLLAYNTYCAKQSRFSEWTPSGEEICLITFCPLVAERHALSMRCCWLLGDRSGTTCNHLFRLVLSSFIIIIHKYHEKVKHGLNVNNVTCICKESRAILLYILENGDVYEKEVRCLAKCEMQYYYPEMYDKVTKTVTQTM